MDVAPKHQWSEARTDPIPAPRIAVVIPCYRVRATILDVIKRIPANVEAIICVDDCCPENAGDHVEAECRDPRVVVVRNAKNLGVGGAMIAGYQAALARGMDIVAKIDGVVTRRNVNPGDYVQVGQNLMAIRSLREIWVDANFKETQLHDLRIGQPVDLYVDMYGSRHVFKGRVAGFTMGTGSTLALLPAQNATGNFVKVVQRLPVRIDLEGYDPDKDTLFIGTSVVPYVHINKPPTGPDAGKFLQATLPQTRTTGLPEGSSGADK